MYAVVRLWERYWMDRADSTVTLNQAQAQEPLFDLIYQLLGIFFALVPVALVVLLFVQQGRNFGTESGLIPRKEHAVKDWLHGVGLFLLIGVGTVMVYQLSRVLGISPQVQYAAGTDFWHEIPVLILRSVENGLLEEVIVVAYLALRVKDLVGLGPAGSGSTGSGSTARLAGSTVWIFLVATSLLRASYHLYQGVGAGVGNFLMGLIFGAYFLKRPRVLPLVIAHTLLDVVGFVGFRLLGPFLGLGS